MRKYHPASDIMFIVFVEEEKLIGMCIQQRCKYDGVTVPFDPWIQTMSHKNNSLHKIYIKKVWRVFNVYPINNWRYTWIMCEGHSSVKCIIPHNTYHFILLFGLFIRI